VLSCLQVFALGGLKGEADVANSGYFAVRGLLAKSVAEAARFMVDRGVLAEGGPVLVRLIAQIASRFGVVVTQKLAARAVPVIGALVVRGVRPVHAGKSRCAQHGRQTGDHRA
jgi:hypothetical protein